MSSQGKEQDMWTPVTNLMTSNLKKKKRDLQLRFNFNTNDPCLYMDLNLMT